MSTPALRRAALDEKLAHSFLPYGRQVIEDDDIAAVAEVLRSDFLTTGPAVARRLAMAFRYEKDPATARNP